MKSQVIARDNSLFQRNVQAAFAELIGIPILNGSLIENVILSTTATKISHKLGRPFTGFIVVKKNANVDIWMDSSAVDNSLFIPLDASGTVTVSLWVF
jgi:hypothetical protein